MQHLLKKVLTTCFCYAALHSTAQQIRGVVTDTSHQPLPAARIAIAGTNKVFLSANDGSFVIKQAGATSVTLVITAVGFQQASLPVTVSGSSILLPAIHLQPHPGNILNEVVVTAGRQAESKSLVPASVFVLNQQQIARQSLVNADISQLLGTAVPGLGLSTNTTNNRGQSLRGRNILVLVDGIPQSTPLRPGARDIRTIDVSAIERVEVLKGATAIYGNGADGGIINVITKKASPGTLFHSTTMASLSGMPLHGSQTYGPRFTETFSGSSQQTDYLLSAAYEHTGVMRDAKGTPLAPFNGLGEMTNVNLLAKLGVRLTPNSRLSLMYNYYHSVQNSSYITQPGKYGVQPSIGIPGNDSIHPGTPYNHNAYLQYQLNKIGSSNTSLTASVFWQRFKTVYDYTTPYPSQLLSNKLGARLFFQSPLALAPALPATITYGADLLQDKTEQPTLSNLTWVPQMNMRNAAPYAQLNVQLLQYVSFKGGVRYELLNIEVPDYNTLPANASVTPKSIHGGTIRSNLLTFNSGLRYTRWLLFNPFVSFSQGYSIADLGRALRTTQNPDIIGGADVQPAISNNYEAGFNSVLGRVNLQFSYYYSTSRKGVYLEEDATTGQLLPERAPERIHGLEGEVNIRISKYLNIGAAYNHTEGKYREEGAQEWTYLGNDRITPDKFTSYLNLQLGNAFSIYLQGIYSGNRQRFAATKPVTSNGTVTGYTWYANEGPIQSFFLLNLSAGYMVSKNWRIQLGTENLLNKDYYTPFSQFSADNRSYVKGNGLRATLGVQYDFGKKAAGLH